MAITFKQKCARCKKNYVTATNRSRNLICFECEKKSITGEIKDPAMKKMFDIPTEFYQENSFLRDIKRNYHAYGKLSDKQIEAFKKTVEKMKERISKEKN